MKGVHRVTKRLASGGVAVYHYAWRGGPRLPGEPGSAEFLAALAAAKAEGPPHHKGTLQEVFNAYQSSPRAATMNRKGIVRTSRGPSSSWKPAARPRRCWRFSRCGR